MTATITESTPVDFDRYYTCKGWGGVAFWLRGYATETVETLIMVCDHEDEADHDDLCGYYEPEEVENPRMVKATMVGDDSVHLIDVDDLIPLSREDFCGECGQIGCTHDGLDRS